MTLQDAAKQNDISWALRPQSVVLRLAVPFVLILAAIIAITAVWDESQRNELLQIQFLESARSYLGHIVLTRQWNAGHGGVYVEVTPGTQPNPYLDDPDRDVVTVNGRYFTKMNPAYMTRQLSDMAKERGLFLFRLASLKPINPINRADQWEAEALERFERGGREAYGNGTIHGVEYFRYMQPLVVTPECMQCHAKQGYRLGDIRGGISISLPVSMQDELHDRLERQSGFVFLFLGMAAVMLLAVVVAVYTRMLTRAIEKSLEAERLKAAMELAGAAAHELRQPMTIVLGVADMIRSKARDGESCETQYEVLEGQLLRMDSIISRMVNITRYKTRKYADDQEIFDLYEASINTEDSGEEAEKS